MLFEVEKYADGVNDVGIRPLLMSRLAMVVVLAVVGNIPLWLHLGQLPDVNGWRGVAFQLCFACWVAAVLLMLLAWTNVWPKLFQATVAALMLVSALSSYFMMQYAIVIDSSMLVNVWHTDAREAADLWSGTLLLWLGGGMGLAWWIWRQRPLHQLALKQRLIAAGTLFLIGLVLAALSLMLMFQDFASLMRNHKEVRYQINPLNSLYAVARVALDQGTQTQAPLTPIGTDARLGASATAATRPPLLVLVVGETARAANFSLGGYGQHQNPSRDTTPVLRTLQATGDLHYFGDVRSCGTNTQASVPCMFSHHGKEGHEQHQAARFENLLDVLQRAGLAVLWVDNQSGCKGVCDRVPHIDTRELKDPRHCRNGECDDEVMLSVLDEQLAALPAERKAKGVVVVLHQMGSHGPAYYKRSPPAHKAFLPECSSNVLSDCSRTDLVNAYDNSIRYTDFFLGQTIAWLQQQSHSAAMLYVSDHGESLGENNLYLHGLPYALAPDVQKQVPMVWWLSPAMRQHAALNNDCIRQQTTQPLSHDYLFHSVLGLLNVETEVYRPTLDLLATCRHRLTP